MTLSWLTRCLPIKSVRGTLELKAHEDPFLDGLRGLSVVMVIVFHTLFAVHMAFQGQPDRFQDFLAQFPDWTHVIFGFDKAVDIFFMLSAYLLGSSLIQQGKNNRIGFRQFYSHRIGRIYPLFLVALLIYGLPTGTVFFQKAWQNLLFIDNYTYTTIIPVGWSLSVEMQCYLLLPFLMLALSKTEHPTAILLILILISVFIRWGITLAEPETVQTRFIDYLAGIKDPAGYMRPLYESTPGRFGSFMVGLLWATIEPTAKNWKINPNLANVIWAVLVLVVLLTLQFPAYTVTATYYNYFSVPLNQTIVVLHRFVFSFALLGMILLVRIHPDRGLSGLFRKLLSLKFWRPFSRLAFPAYLFHFPFVAIAWLMIVQTTDIQTIPLPSLGQALMAMILTSTMVLWFSLPIHYKIERVGIRWGKKMGDKWAVKM